MKTQLLEDIGQSAPLSLTPSKTAGHAKAEKEEKEVQNLAPAGNAQPARSRSAPGVWRQKPSGETIISTAQHPEEAPSLELDKVFEEIAALEAQFVAPGQQHEPAAAAVEPRHEVPAPPAGSLHEPAIPPAEATPAPDPAPRAAAPQEPLFDFTPPSPERQAADPFTPAPAGPARSRPRYFLWTACVLAAALLIQGGRWLYQERSDANSLALIANEAKQQPPGDQAVQRQAIAAKGAALEPGADAPVPSATPASPSPAVPPLVMLEPDPPAGAKPEQPSPSVAAQAEPPMAPKPGPAAEQRPASPLPKPPGRRERAVPDAVSGAAAAPAKERARREPERQLARASAIGKERPSGQESSLAATLKACREHGYHATQCIKQDCRVTQYGFACRGR